MTVLAILFFVVVMLRLYQQWILLSKIFKTDHATHESEKCFCPFNFCKYTVNFV